MPAATENSSIKNKTASWMAVNLTPKFMDNIKKRWRKISLLTNAIKYFLNKARDELKLKENLVHVSTKV